MIRFNSTRRVRRELGRRLTLVRRGVGGIPRQGLLYYARYPLYEDWSPYDFESYTITDDFVWLGHKLPADLFEVLGEGFWFTADGTPITRVPSEIIADSNTNQWAVWFDQNRGRLAVYDPAVMTVSLVNRTARYFKQAQITEEAVIFSDSILLFKNSAILVN